MMERHRVGWGPEIRPQGFVVEMRPENFMIRAEGARKIEKQGREET